MGSSPLPKLTSMGLVAGTFRMLAGRPVLLGLLAVLASLPVLVAAPEPRAPGAWARVGLTLGQLWAYGVACGVTLHELAARTPDLSHLARRALRRIPAMFVASFFSSLVVVGLLIVGLLAAHEAGDLFGLVLGGALIIAAGVATAFRVSLPVAFAEGVGGLAALRRSATLTRGRRLRIFLADVVLAIVQAPFIVIVVRDHLDSDPRWWAHLGTSALAFAVSVTYASVLYGRLRRLEGTEPADLARSL